MQCKDVNKPQCLSAGTTLSIVFTCHFRWILQYIIIGLCIFILCVLEESDVLNNFVKKKKIAAQGCVVEV